MRWMYGRSIIDPAQMTDLSVGLRASLVTTVDTELPRVKKLQRATDGTLKWLLDVGGGQGVREGRYEMRPVRVVTFQQCQQLTGIFGNGAAQGLYPAVLKMQDPVGDVEDAIVVSNNNNSYSLLLGQSSHQIHHIASRVPVK